MNLLFLNSTHLLAILAAFGGGIISFCIGLLMERYKNRSLELIKTITFQKIGLPSDSYIQGNLKITYNEIEVNSLYLFKLELKNNSNFDSKQLPLHLTSDSNSYILSYSITWMPDTTIITTDKEYDRRLASHLETINEILTENPSGNWTDQHLSEDSWLQKNRILTLNSLNRKERIELTILIGSNIKDHQPYLFLQMPTPGIILIDSIDPIKNNERIGKTSMIIGIFITTCLGIIFIKNYNEHSQSKFIILTIVGSLNFIIGIVIYSLGRFIHSYFK